MIACECYDQLCPHTASGGCDQPATVRTLRTDCEKTYVDFCDVCASDAHDSGLFAYIRELGESE